MVVHAYYPYDETRVQRQAEALLAAGFEVDVLCLRHGDEARRENVSGVAVHRLPIRRNRRAGRAGQLFEYLHFFFLATLWLARLWQRRRYNVVQVHNLPDFLVFSALVPRLFGSRIILDIHDLMPEFYCSRFGGSMQGLSARLLLLQERLSCRFAHHVITVTKGWRRTLIRRGQPESRCSVVMNMADPAHFRALQQASASGPNGDGQDGFNLIYHGSLVHRYGIDLILQALPGLRARIPGLRFTILGRGEFLDSLMKLLEDLKVSDLVQVETRFLPLGEMVSRIAACDLGLVPYRNDLFTDGILPTKLMEYVALEVPAIAARTSGISAYFDETMVEFFSPEDVEDLSGKIWTLYCDRERRRNLVANAARFHERYNWPDQSGRYVEVVKKLSLT